MNRVYEYFTSPVFRGYNYTADAEICPPGALYEVVFADGTYKTAIFEEMLTKGRIYEKEGESRVQPSAKSCLTKNQILHLKLHPYG